MWYIVVPRSRGKKGASTKREEGEKEKKEKKRKKRKKRNERKKTPLARSLATPHHASTYLCII